MGDMGEKIKANKNQDFYLPMEELANLGAGVAPLIPAFRTVTETMEMNTGEFFKLADEETAELMKRAKDGNWWENIKARTGEVSKAQFCQIKEGVCKQTIDLPIDAAQIMMAASLFSVLKEISEIERIGKEIENFLLEEKKEEIELAVEQLISIGERMKDNWLDEDFIKESYQVVVDIKTRAKNKITAFQTQVVSPLNSNKIITSYEQNKEILDNLVKDFRYYRLDLYIFSCASYLEILLGGNFDEDYIREIKIKAEDHSHKYRSILTRCTDELDRRTKQSIRTNTIKEALENGVVKEGGNHLKSHIYEVEKKTLEEIVGISNPGTIMFIRKMDDLIQLYNRTKDICFDKENIYFVE